MEEVGQWLESLGLGQYADAFRDNAVDWALLPKLTAEELKEIGVGALGHRKRILEAAAAIDLGAVPAAAPAAPAPDAERRQLTVLFCDLVGSTALSAALDPEDMRKVVLRYQDVCAGVIARYEGFLARLMGDGVLAYFGYPRAHEDEPERAVRAGLELARAVGELDAPTGEALAARIGVATGLVVVGDLVGEGAAQEQAVVGDAPNLAARLQAIASPGQVVIADATRRLLGTRFTLDDLGTRQLKGIDRPVPVTAVSGERPVATRFDARGESGLPMVGRDQELALLLERWSLAKASEGQGVLLVGEAGIGKSRIGRAVLDAVADEPHVRILYQCSAFHRDSALWPVIQQLGHAIGLSADGATDASLDKLEAFLGRAFDEVESVAPLIVSLLGLDGTARYGRPELSTQGQRTRTLEALTQQLLGYAARQPTLVVLEDAHWIDPTTLELIEQCLDQIADARVLMVVTSRVDEQPALAAHPHVTRLTLNRLSRGGVETIVARLGGDRLPASTLDAIIARTDGVPLFVEELTKAVLETGEASIPASLHDSLMARLDRFPDVKEVAQTAACIGREFRFSLLASVAERPEADLSSALDRLVASDLIFRRGAPPRSRYTFKHALVQDAAYESLLRSRRRQLHARIARVLEERFPETVESEPEVLAYHCQAGGLTAPAIAYWAKAGERAVGRFAYPEAIAHLNRAMELLATTPAGRERDGEELELLCRLGPALMSSKGWSTDEVGSTYARALELSRAIGDDARLFDVLRGLWTFHLTRSNLRTALEYGSQMLELAERTADAGDRLEAHRSIACARIWRGEFLQAREHFEAGKATADRREYDTRAAGYGHHAGVVCRYLGAQTLWCLGFPDQGRDWAREARELAREATLPYSLSIALLHSALLHLYRGEPQAAVPLIEEGGAVASKFGFPALSAELTIGRGVVLAEQGEAEAGLTVIREGLDDFRRMDLVLNRAVYLALLAEVCAGAGHVEQGLAALEEAAELVSRTEEGFAEAEIHRVRGELLLGTADAAAAPRAEASLLAALDVARRQSAKSWELRAATSLARLWRDQGKRAQARDLLAPVCAWFTEGLDTTDLEDAGRLLEELRAR